ncbi:MAG: type IV pilin protein [Patescibacteria group bacterium]
MLKRHNRKAFTLVELIVVIVILAVLAAIAFMVLEKMI